MRFHLVAEFPKICPHPTTLEEGATYSVGELWGVENEVEEPLVERIVLADHLCNGRREKRLL